MKEIGKIDKSRHHVDGIGRKFKSPVEKRVLKSKFAKIISKLSNEELKALAICLLGKNHIKAAIDCYSQSVEHGTQLYALEKEMEKRIMK